MSIAEKITKLQTDIYNSYDVIEENGGVVPKNKNTENLASAIESITGGGSASTLQSISITKTGATEYFVGETFSLNDYTIIANYSNGNTLDVTEYCTFTPSGALNVENTSITITYTSVESEISKSVTQEITVMEQVINYKMLYDYGDECTNVTGGWDNYLTDGVSSYWKDVGKLIKNTDNIQMLDTDKSSDTHMYKSLYANKTIDIGEYVGALTVSEVISKAFKSTSGCRYRYMLELRTAMNGSSTYAKMQHLFIDNSEVGKYTNTVKFSDYIADYSITNLNVGFLSLTEGASFNGKVYALAFVKEDNWQTLANLAGITASSIDDILTNSTTLLSNEKAVKYMIYNCTGLFMASAIQSNTFLTALNNSSYKTIIQANEHWNKFLNMVA